MPTDQLKTYAKAKLSSGRMIVAFSGWMDGGDVSTGTVNLLTRTLEARKIAEIEPDDFYIYNFPGSMEISALFRPHVKIEHGLIEEYEPPSNVFYCADDADLVLFAGKEPNIRWPDFADCIFSLASQAGVQMIYFIGSVAGLVPHTREPRLFCTVSHADLKPTMAEFGLGFTSYEGPSSFITRLLTEVDHWGLKMASIVAEIPAYVQGANPKSIESVTRKLAAVLGLQMNLEELRTVSDAWEKKLNETLEDRDDLLEHIEKLEEDYDSDVFDTQMGDLKDWLQQKGIRLD